MGKSPSPGPIYKLPPTIGFKDHDMSRYRNPQYSMAVRLGSIFGGGEGPGPQYQIRGMTEHGKATQPAYSLRPHYVEITSLNVPGPGTYSPEKAPRTREQRPPAYSMSTKTDVNYQTIGPGPLAYKLPSMLGPKVPNKQAAGAFTMVGKYRELTVADTPSPASYPGADVNTYRQRRPRYTMSPRWFEIPDKTNSPGPAGYTLMNKVPGKNAPKYSMGLMANEASSPYITPQDNMPCTRR